MMNILLSIMLSSFAVQANPPVQQPNPDAINSSIEKPAQTIPSGEKTLYQDSVNTLSIPNAPASNTSINNSKTKEMTLSILKPDAIKNRHIGDILSRFENNGLRIVAIKMMKLNAEEASKFYHVHQGRPFFQDLVSFMSSGPVVILVLEGDQAVSKNRQLMGATDPKKADQGTIRADFSESVSQNTVHGSDSAEAATEEISFFFKPNEIFAK